MLVWKTQTLNVNVASLRYRCLLPLRYLDKIGISSVICSGADPIKINADTQAAIFVKSFRKEDVTACEQAYQLGVPVILDICDNIFIEEYALGSDYVPAHNFLLMAQMATAIVTTGTAMKAAVEKVLIDAAENSISPPSSSPSIVVIPDGSESLSDIQYAVAATRWQRPQKLRWRPIKLLRCRMKLLRQVYKRIKRAAKQLKRFAKVVVYGMKGQIGQVLRRYGLLTPLPASQVGRQPMLRPSSPLEADVTSTAAASQPLTSLGMPSREKAPTEATPLWPKPWPEAKGVKTVLWFGNYGAKYGNFGMLNVLEVADAIASISQDCRLRLMVVSNSRATYQRHIAPLPFTTQYLRWHPRKIYDYIQASDVVIIPNSQSIYSICKSANRAVLSLAQGTPVVASRTPALEMFADCVYLDDWEAGLRAYLLSSEVGKAHVAQAQQVISQHLSGEVIAQQWLSLLKQIAPPLAQKDAA